MSNSVKGKFIIVSGPSGSGKTTLHKALLESQRLKGKLVKSLSATTRPRRQGERHGRDYLFLDTDVFEKRIGQDYFLEWEKVFDNYYGTPKRQALNLLKKGINVLLCIDVKGAKQVREKYPQAVSIFIKTPTIKILEDRLRKRASETHETLSARLKVARAELKQAKHYDYQLINGHLGRATKELEKIVLEALGMDNCH